MKLYECLAAIEQRIPQEWALPNDPVGLQIGDPEKTVERVFVALEVTAEIIQKSRQRKANLLLVHHPLIYRPLKNLIVNRPVQRCVCELIRNSIALYAAHTNFDLHPEGMAKVWAKRLGCAQAEPMLPKPQAGQLKIVTFVPPEYTDPVRRALSQAGAGRIGEYDLCSFSMRGMGTFQGSEHTNPFVGQSGVFERQEEERLEMIFPISRKTAVVKALYAAHPYEEPAYDIYPLEEVHDLRQALWIVEFHKKLSWDEFASLACRSTPVPGTPISVRPDKRKKIQRIALSTGSGNDLIAPVVGMKVDAFLTGEVGHHLLWEAEELGLNVLTVGHKASESMFPEAIIDLLQPRMEEIQWMKT